LQPKWAQWVWRRCVHLNDSGNNAGRDEQVPLATFERSWATGGNYAIVTR